MIAFRYVLRLFLVRAALCLAGGLVLYLAADLVESGKALARLGVGGGEAAWMTLLAAPRAAMQLLPAAALLAAFLSAGALRRRGEIEALRALGRGPAALAAPLLAGGALCALLAAGLAETAVPPATAALDATRARHGWFGSDAGTGESFVRDAEGTIWRVRGRSADGTALAAATGFHLAGDGAPAWRADLEELRWDGAAWSYRRGVTRRLGGGAGAGAGVPGGAGAAAAGRVPLLPPEALDPPPRESDALSARALGRRLTLLAAVGKASPRLEVELWGRAELPLLALAGALAAVPFGLGARRRSARARAGPGVTRPAAPSRIAPAGAREALGAALAVALTLWLLVATGRALGAAGVIAPALATLAPPLLVVAAVAIITRRQRS